MADNNGEFRRWVNTGANVSKAKSLERMADASQARLRMAQEKRQREEDAAYQRWMNSQISTKDQKILRDKCFESFPEIFEKDRLKKWNLREDFIEGVRYKDPLIRWCRDNQINGYLIFLVGAVAGWLGALIAKMMIM